LPAGEAYESSALYGIAAVQKNAPAAAVVDLME
jgi:uncharacterized protein YegP (UPF0339 family)